MEPDFNVTPNFQALDDVTMEPVSNPAPNLAQDSTRVQPPSGEPGTRPQQGPTLADIVSGAEPIVRGMSAAEHQQQRVQLPRPRAADIAAILQLYESTTPDGAAVREAAKRALPFVLPRAQFECVIETNTTLASTAPSRILQSFATQHGNEVVAELIRDNQIGQLSKMPRGNLCVKVKTEAACRRLEGQEVKILGYTFKFRERNPLDDRFYIDISGVSSDSSVDTLFGRLFDIGARPIYATNREVHLKTGITTATWRVYFFDQQAPKALVINGGIVDQLVFKQRLHFVNAKNASPPTDRPKFGQRSAQCLDLDIDVSRARSTQGPTNQSPQTPAQGPPNQAKSTSTVSSVGGKPAPKVTGTAVQNTRASTKSTEKVAKIDPKSTPTSKIQVYNQVVEQENKGENKPRATENQAPTTVPATFSTDSSAGETRVTEVKSAKKRVLSPPSKPKRARAGADDDEMTDAADFDGLGVGAGDEALSDLSLEDNVAMSPPLSPVGSTPSSGPDDGFELQQPKKRCFHVKNTVPRIVQHAPTVGGDWTDGNFFAVLGEVQGTFQVEDYANVDDSSDHAIGPFQIVPQLPEVPKSVRASKCQTKKFVKFETADGVQVAVDDDWVAMDEFCQELAQAPIQAAKHSTDVVNHQLKRLPKAEKNVRSEPNIDTIVEDMLRQPWTYSQLLVEMARDEDFALEELATVHAFNRLLITLAPSVVQPYTVRQCISKGRTAPSREAVYSTLRGWFQGQDNKGFDTHRLFDEWRALAFFELLLFVTAPHIVRSDAWVQFITRMPVEWLAHRHVRLLKTPVLLTLLRTTMGQFVLKRLESQEWSSDILETLQELKTSSLYEDGIEPTLITTEDDQVDLHVVMAKRC